MTGLTVTIAMELHFYLLLRSWRNTHIFLSEVTHSQDQIIQAAESFHADVHAVDKIFSINLFQEKSTLTSKCYLFRVQIYFLY